MLFSRGGGQFLKCGRSILFRSQNYSKIGGTSFSSMIIINTTNQTQTKFSKSTESATNDRVERSLFHQMLSLGSSNDDDGC
ncbi:hypothetical protein AKO1_015482 [Acrasis kona]|uniref:Uncharacterized protein n=1 Tax=Acrasis kona TaxID=1008807 RepID=A0AAW2ZH10_9EUKA